jgi:hypothetical protein
MPKQPEPTYTPNGQPWDVSYNMAQERDYDRQEHRYLTERRKFLELRAKSPFHECGCPTVDGIYSHHWYKEQCHDHTKWLKSITK